MNFGPNTVEADSFKLLDHALDNDINFVDTADQYGGPLGVGATESIIGGWLAQGAGRREKVVLATKLYEPMSDRPNDRGLSARHIRLACDASLRRLQTDHIDVYQMHHIDRTAPWDEVWQAMEILVAQGKISYVGSSNFAGWTVAQANEAAASRHFLGLVSEQSLYNLVFIPDAVRPGHFHIETFEDYISGGETKDWSSKVDYGKDVVIKPTTDLQAAQYRWTYSSGKDFVTKTVEESLARVYGEYEVTDTGNEFATGINEVKTKFAPYLMSLVPGTATPILRLITQDGQPVKGPAPRIAYWGGFGSSFGSFYLKRETGVDTQISSFPVLSNYSAPVPDPGDNDLNYGMEPAMYPIVAQPAHTLYFRFWATYVLELYSTEARVLSCNMNLTEEDLQSWNFNDKIYIKDTYYRILSISYDANAPGTAQVELLRKLDDIDVCADTPTGLQANATIVTFNNSAIDYGSEACCVLYGYDWRVNRDTLEARCHVNTQQLDI